MKISVVHSFYSDSSPSGENIVVRQQVQQLLDAGHDVQLVAISTDDLSDRPAYKLRTAWNVATAGGESPLKALDKFAPDVVHVHNLFPNYSTAWLTAWRGPVVSTVHNFRPACAGGLLLRDGLPCTLCPDKSSINAVIHACYRDSRLASIPLAVRNRRGVGADKVLSRSDRIIYPAQHVRWQYEQMGAPAARGIVIPHFSLPPEPFPGDMTQSVLPEAPWLFIGRLSEEKGILPLLDGWPPDIPLIIYGTGPLLDKVLARCRDKIRYAGLARHEDIKIAIQHCRGVVIPSVWLEIGPLTYAEALSCARPVAAKSGNGAAFDIEKANTGSVFESFEGLPAALRAVDSDWKAFSARAAARYAAIYAPEAWTRKTIACYEAAIGGTADGGVQGRCDSARETGARS